MKGFRSGKSGNRTREARAAAANMGESTKGRFLANHYLKAAPVFRKPARRIMARRKRYDPPPIHAAPIRPVDRMSAEMWADYWAYRSAGMLHVWRQKWAAHLAP